MGKAIFGSFMRAIKYVKDPNALQVIADPTRRRVIYLLRAKEMTVSQIAAELDMTPQAIYHHIKKLLETGLIEVAKEARVDHFIETYYMATAEVFEFHHGESTGEFYEGHLQEAVAALAKLDLDIEIDKDTMMKIVGFENKIHSIMAGPELDDKINQLEDVDFMTKEELYKFVQFLVISDKQFEEYLNVQRELREFLKSRLVDKKG